MKTGKSGRVWGGEAKGISSESVRMSFFRSKWEGDGEDYRRESDKNYKLSYKLVTGVLLTFFPAPLSFLSPENSQLFSPSWSFSSSIGIEKKIGNLPTYLISKLLPISFFSNSLCELFLLYLLIPKK